MKEKIYDVMENVIGWNLYGNYDNVAQQDLNYLTKVWNQLTDWIENGNAKLFTLNDLEDLRDSLGFCIDFMRAVAIIDNTEKLKKEEN